ncbi:hypothetical protein H4R20_002729 [Coemansia guatemalensis]|uniref:polynucleotide adenylyltransferase n=1 Tax=Coemansia guatemalensis TaxID=2761395 RepID=A0A9W8HZF8_9FUNG|nr:hypothetical protein H4R20_002729 [Coemansia guatemalensis]
MVASTAVAPQPDNDVKSGGPEDFISLDLLSSEGEEEEEEGEEAEDDNSTSGQLAGKKRRQRDSDDDDEDGADGSKRQSNSTSYRKCYNGVPVPPWLVGAHRLGHGKRPDISDMLNEEVERFTAYISPTPEEHQMRQWVIERMQRVLDNMHLPEITPAAKCFGSFETQMYLPTSDIDMTVMLYEKKTMRVSDDYSYKEAVQRFLYSLASHMRKSGFCTNCQVIARARVPIIKTNERISGIAVDISVNADSGMKSAAVQRSLSENTYPGALRPIVLAIKQFLYQRSMNEVYTGGMGSYAITLLVVSLLQMHPRIRSGGLEVSKNLGVILVEFFELYGKRFNYDNTCVGVLEQGQYLCKRRKGFFNPTQPYLLSIEDPCDPSNDVTKGTHGINRIKQTFGGAYDLLNNAIFAYHQTRKFGKPVNDTLRDIAGINAPGTNNANSSAPNKKRVRAGDGRSRIPDPDDALTFNSDPWAPVSFLSSILHIDSRAIAKRSHLVRTFNEGTMQKELGVQYMPQLVNLLPQTAGASNGHHQTSKSDNSGTTVPSGTAQEQISRMVFDFAGNGANHLKQAALSSRNSSTPIVVESDGELPEDSNAEIVYSDDSYVSSEDD